MNSKRVEEVVDMAKREAKGWETWTETFKRVLSNLPEFQTPEEKWIKCSERMPENKALVYVFVPEKNQVFEATMDNPVMYHLFVVKTDTGQPWLMGPKFATHWMPRHVPEAPKEESQLKKDLAEIWRTGPITFERVMQAVEKDKLKRGQSK